MPVGGGIDVIVGGLGAVVVVVVVVVVPGGGTGGPPVAAAASTDEMDVQAGFLPKFSLYISAAPEPGNVFGTQESDISV